MILSSVYTLYILNRHTCVINYYLLSTHMLIELFELRLSTRHKYRIPTSTLKIVKHAIIMKLLIFLMNIKKNTI